MFDKILLVDDDANLLAGCRRSLRGVFDVETAEGGEEGLNFIAEKGPFAVILADMRMPGMDGIQFLSKVKNITPDSVRMMLTGNADQATAMNAVNEGQIFRFLTKPCPKKTLISTIEAGIKQYQLVVAERQVLEETLNGSVKILVDILSLIKPKAFGRANRIWRYVRHMTKQLSLPNSWQFEIAAMLSQLGCVSLPDNTLDKFFAGQELSSDEQSNFDSHPRAAGKLLGNIPRLKEVAEMIVLQRAPCPNTPVTEQSEVTLGSQILRTALDFDQLISHGVPPDLAVDTLRQNKTSYDPTIIEAIASLDVSLPEYAKYTVNVEELMTGMILEQDVLAENGRLLVTYGQEVTSAILEHLQRWDESTGVKQPIRIAAPNYKDQNTPQQKSVKP